MTYADYARFYEPDLPRFRFFLPSLILIFTCFFIFFSFSQGPQLPSHFLIGRTRRPVMIEAGRRPQQQSLIGHRLSFRRFDSHDSISAMVIDAQLSRRWKCIAHRLSHQATSLHTQAEPPDTTVLAVQPLDARYVYAASPRRR